jgi:hypothetical protein
MLVVISFFSVVGLTASGGQGDPEEREGRECLEKLN